MSILSPRAAAPRGNAARRARPASAGASARRPWRSPRMAYETAKGGDACRSVCPAALAIDSSAPNSCIREIPSPPAPPVRVSACALPERRPLGRTAGIGPCGRTTARPPSFIFPPPSYPRPCGPRLHVFSPNFWAPPIILVDLWHFGHINGKLSFRAPYIASFFCKKGFLDASKLRVILISHRRAAAPWPPTDRDQKSSPTC